MHAPDAPHCPVYWPRAIILVDMDAFFASVEQRDFPELRGRAVVVTNGEAGSTIITCSYEARALGIKTGMRLKEARLLCPDLIRQPTRPEVYAEVSTQIMRALANLTPTMEVFSVDEAFLDVTQCQRLFGTPARMARLAKKLVFDASGLHCSVGVSGDRTTAKYAAKLQKPDGLTVIPPWEATARLAPEPTTALCGIAGGIGRFLAQHGVVRCGDMHKLPISVLARRFGNPGRRIWLMCQGRDPEPIHTDIPGPKSVGHGKVLPPGTRARDALLIYLHHMSEKVAARLRKHDLEAQRYFIGLKLELGWVGAKLQLATPEADGNELFALCRFVLESEWHGEAVGQVQVTALDPRPAQRQLGLFDDNHARHERDAAHHAVDSVNARFGKLTLAPARLLGRDDQPDVIAPAWKPDGLRRTV